MSHTKGLLLAIMLLSYAVFSAVFTAVLLTQPLAPRPLRLHIAEPPAAFSAALLTEAMAVDLSTDYDKFAHKFLRGLTKVKQTGAVKAKIKTDYDYSQLPDFAAIKNTAARKRAFFDYLRPAIEYQNQIISERRLLLRGIEIRLANKLALTPEQDEFMLYVRKRYKVAEEADLQQAIDDLWRRMDTIPASMVLAQAAVESGWGRSRFAREANNLFGQWCYTAGCGLVPSSRTDGKRHEVRKFDGIDKAIAAYFININAFHRYRGLRDIRSASRAANKPPSGHDMVGGLGHYSERGDEYIKQLRRMIRYNKLE